MCSEFSGQGPAGETVEDGYRPYHTINTGVSTVRINVQYNDLAGRGTRPRSVAGLSTSGTKDVTAHSCGAQPIPAHSSLDRQTTLIAVFVFACMSGLHTSVDAGMDVEPGVIRRSK